MNVFIIRENLVTMNYQPCCKPILIYFKTRGNAQIIRSVLYEIGAEFQQIFIQFNGYLDPTIIKNYQINFKQLPYLLHNGLTINGIFPIIKYCCTYFQRPDLLGKTFYDTVQITQFMVKQINQKGIILHTLFTGLKEVKQKNTGEKGLYELAKKLYQVVQNMKLIRAVKQMFGKTGQFLLGYLTVLDFALYERIFYVTNLLSLERVPDLQFAMKYRLFFQSTDFYKKHESNLSQYKIFFPEFDCDLNNLLQKMWKGDPKYI